MHHWHSFIDAVRGEAPVPSANFDYSGPLTETVLLGGIATRIPQAGTNLGRNLICPSKTTPRRPNLVQKEIP